MVQSQFEPGSIPADSTSATNVAIEGSTGVAGVVVATLVGVGVVVATLVGVGVVGVGVDAAGLVEAEASGAAVTAGVVAAALCAGTELTVGNSVCKTLVEREADGLSGRQETTETAMAMTARKIRAVTRRRRRKAEVAP
jgi:hypothetical protein